MAFCHKKWVPVFVLHKKCLTFVIAKRGQSHKASGTLDEWLSQWSAKPCTAVRIRQVPQRVLVKNSFFYSYNF